MRSQLWRRHTRRACFDTLHILDCQRHRPLHIQSVHSYRVHMLRKRQP
jgi:hypothetical protein